MLCASYSAAETKGFRGKGACMTIRERILAVYRGEVPDVVPYMLDLSHWFYHRRQLPWDLDRAYMEPEHELIEYHRRHDIGFYIANLGSFFDAEYPADVKASVFRVDGETPEIAWRYETPLGSIERRRRWSAETYSWHISRWGVRTEQEIRILAYALGGLRFRPAWTRYRAWVKEVGDCGVVYASPGYSAMGHLLNYWMGIERVMYAAADWPETVHQAVDRINQAVLRLVDLLAESPAEVIIMGDNFSSDIQSPRFFAQWSRRFYAEAIRRLHARGKYAAVYIDGRLRGLLAAFAELGTDCADAVTPAPMGDLTPEECRSEAGPRLVASGERGGVSECAHPLAGTGPTEPSAYCQCWGPSAARLCGRPDFPRA